MKYNLIGQVLQDWNNERIREQIQRRITHLRYSEIEARNTDRFPIELRFQVADLFRQYADALERYADPVAVEPLTCTWGIH